MRSSRGKVVTCLGVEWLVMALLVPVPWSQRVWALPFLTLLMPSKQADSEAGRRHRTTVEWTIVMVRLVARWLDRRPWILIGDGRYACIHLGWECLVNQATLISRLRLDARLFGPPRAGAGRTARAQAPERRALGQARRARGGGAHPGRGDHCPWYRGQRKTLRVLSAPPCGTRPASPRCRFAGCWWSIPRGVCRPRPSSPRR